jgi:OmpA-OmpF porin, OOP family
MSLRFKLMTPVMAATLLAGAASTVHAQGWLKRVKDAAKETVARKAEKGAVDATSSAVDAATGKIKCAVTDSDCIDKAKAAGKGTILVDANGNPVAAAQGSSDASASVATDVGSDFTPGTRVLFADDFKSDEIGNFPRGFELKAGNMEVADIGGTRYLRSTSRGGKFDIVLPAVLPDQFTMEFDFSGGNGWYQEIHFTDRNDVNYVSFRPENGGIYGPQGYSVESRPAVDPGALKVFPVKIMADGDYVKVYMNGTRVANAPNAKIGRSTRIHIEASGTKDSPTLMGNFRIAAGGKDLYKALSSTGRVTTDGVLFDTGSDHIRPESAPALKEIGDMLAAHGDLKVSIEGHTDNVGNAQTNMTLSEKRAAAVKTYLVSTLGVSAARLTSRGYGDTKPVADNATPEGRQKNRRVELVKQ